VGLGTFRELRAEDLDRGELHEEPWSLPAETGQALARCRARGGRVVAVGTTSARALESAALASALGGGLGRTRLFIQPGFRFQVVDRLLTNLHLPGSSLMMLVSAFAGRERIRAAYAEAVAQRYRFFSYGDAMWLRPPLSWSADPQG
jgi:S-adenosylmethionine:tRNA ribosyltransferase-isomerase